MKSGKERFKPSRSYERGTGTPFTLFSHMGREIIRPTSTLLNQLGGIDEIVRVHDDEYPNPSLTPGSVVTHYNLPIYDARVGHTAIFARVLRPGLFDPGVREVLPLLSFENTLWGRVIEVMQNIPYDQLNSGHFINAIGGASNTEELQRIMLKRYHASMPTMTDADILKSLSVRVVQIEGHILTPSLIL